MEYRIQHLNFAYQEEPVLVDLNLTLPAGELYLFPALLVVENRPSCTLWPASYPGTEGP